MQDVVLRAAERVRELQAAGVRVEAAPEDTPSPKQESARRLRLGTSLNAGVPIASTLRVSKSAVMPSSGLPVPAIAS
jgi:hypothetical protein